MQKPGTKFIYQHIFMQYIGCKLRTSVLGSGQIFTAKIQIEVSAYQNILSQAIVAHEKKCYRGKVLLCPVPGTCKLYPQNLNVHFLLQRCFSLP